MSDNATIAIGKLLLLGVESKELVDQLALNAVAPKSSSPIPDVYRWWFLEL